MGTWITGIIVFGVVAAIIVKLLKDSRKGKCAGCSCADCSTYGKGCGNDRTVL